MKIKKPLVTAGIVSGVALAAIVGMAAVSAESTPTNHQTSLIQKIAQKFNLKEADVKAVFDEDKAAHQAEHQQKLEDRLNQAVKDGKLTSEQKDKIIVKLKELETQRQVNRDSLKDKTFEERRAAMEAEHAALEQWAKDNNIPLEYLRFGRGKVMFGPGPGMME